ncbi:hypothetical protein DICA3_F15940 [Diutina catenulata]
MGDELKSVVDNYAQIDPKKLFQLVSKNYEAWQSAMNSRVTNDLDEGYSPFPVDPDDVAEPSDPKGGQPIFNYSLLELLEQAPAEFDLQAILAPNKDTPATNGSSSDNPIKAATPEVDGSILNESEIDFLRQKISNMINFRPSRGDQSNPYGGMSLYDTQDEKGIVDDDDQDDYDLDEITSDDYSHAIEVELNSHHQDEHCMCGGTDDEGPTCEFTFEYDNSGKLVPTYSNVEEKLRLLSLQQKLTGNNAMKLPSISELNLIDNPAPKKKKKSKKKKKAHEEPAPAAVETPAHPDRPPPPPGGLFSSTDCCLFCEYEFIFGKKPRQLIKWYDQRLRREEQRRQEIKRKIETVKQRAMKRQRDTQQPPTDHPQPPQGAAPPAPDTESPLPPNDA